MENNTATTYNVTFGRGTAVHIAFDSEATGSTTSLCGAGVVRPNGGATKVLKATRTDAPATCKTCTKKAPKPTGPARTANGRLDHSTCSHDRTPKGRAACRKALGA